jgi:hypothetical protein
LAIGKNSPPDFGTKAATLTDAPKASSNAGWVSFLISFEFWAINLLGNFGFLKDQTSRSLK